MWTGQRKIVLDELSRTGRYVVKKAYVDQKYEESAWIFQTAYQALARMAEKRIPRPENAESPVWVYCRSDQISGGDDVHYIRLSVPTNQILLFDSRVWNRILNLNYIGRDENDEKAFEEALRRKGIEDPLHVFSMPCYPLEKREIMKSWERLLDFKYGRLDVSHTQGMIWEIRSEWMEEVL